MSVKTVYLSLGSNLGDRQLHLQRAVACLEGEGVKVQRQSSLYETEPQDVARQPWFLNIVVRCETQLFPVQLLKVLQRIERELGRIRAGAVRRGPRVIDIDILLYGNAVIDTPQLTVPHPRMTERRFVLEPLLEIAPELRHPVTKQLLRKYLDTLTGQQVRKAQLQ
ncbi:MAG: 2-amino-4-hydroxy-6-hydroxymethyldihydropteridine diphosphokinase [Acidobacteriaceae bacterium]|nr:2-amino-4-hydroxy-6-hydroxymethyldihydropteridine diphosphokinase [Acidobacteriaceae bacterium]